MKNINLLSVIIPAAFLVLMASCADDPVIPNEEELITTVIWTFTPDGGGASVELRFTDLDGDGGDPPVITGGTLSGNTTYSAVLSLLNESMLPALDITDEIEAEGEDHQFFFELGGSLDLDITYSDQDDSGNPIGLRTSVRTGSASLGTIALTLRHEPDKSAAGVPDGDMTNAGGETDIEVFFDVEIQ